MNSAFTQGSPTPTWKVLTWVVPLVSVLAGGVTALFTGGMEYGKFKSTLDAERSRSDQLIKQLQDYQNANQKWSEAHSKIQAELAQARTSLAAIQNDQCMNIKYDIDSISLLLARADNAGYSQQRRMDLHNQYNQSQESLRACFKARK